MQPTAGQPRILSFAGNEMKCLGITEEDGVQVGRYLKDIMRVGTFKHPQQGWTLALDHAKLDQYARNFNAMQNNGVDVEFVVNHDLKAGANRVHGETETMYRDGDMLMSRICVRGKEGNDLVARVKNVSVEINEPFVDGMGNEYDEAITAVALVEKPIITKQGPFRKAASIYSFDATVPATPPVQPGTLDAGTMELIKLIAEITGQPVTDVATAAAALRALAQQKAGDVAPKTVAASVISNVDPDVIRVCSENINIKLDGLVQTGALTPDCRKKLGAVILGTTEKPHTLALSTKATDALGINIPTAQAIVEALAGNKPTKLAGQKSGAQDADDTKPAGKQPGSDDGDDDDDDVEAETKKWAQRQNPGGMKTAAASA